MNLKESQFLIDMLEFYKEKNLIKSYNLDVIDKITVTVCNWIEPSEMEELLTGVLYVAFDADSYYINIEVLRMINIIEDKAINHIKKELIRQGIVQDLKINPRTNTVTLKANIDKSNAKLLATKIMMSLATNKFGNVKVEVVEITDE